MERYNLALWKKKSQKSSIIYIIVVIFWEEENDKSNHLTRILLSQGSHLHIPFPISIDIQTLAALGLRQTQECTLTQARSIRFPLLRVWNKSHEDSQGSVSMRLKL